MPTLSQPSIFYPPHIVKSEEILSFLDKMHPALEHKQQAFRMINNSAVKKRHLAVPIDELALLGGAEERSVKYQEIVRKLSLQAVTQALKNACVDISDISMIIVTSCTGFMMPSLTACLINEFRFPDDIIQLPVAQMGCAAGAYAINRAFEHCQQSHKNALIVCIETSSLCFQKDKNRIQDFISNALFADGVAAVVMRGDDQCKGFKIERIKSHFLYDTEEYIRYNIRDSGYHFSLDKNVMYSIERVAPYMSRFIAENETDGKLVFFILHTGGRRILDEVERCLNLDNRVLKHSRECLMETGNTSSVSVIDVLQRHFKERKEGERGFLAAFGPGFSTEMSIGVWI